MEKHFSLYLDVIRFMAAVFVVLTHYLQHGIVGENISHMLPDFGREAVIIFFVLSGYVIAHVAKTKNRTIKQYIVARAARIYSVAPPLLLLAFIAAYLGEIYSGKNLAQHYQIVKAYFYIPFHGLFLGELWNMAETPLWLNPYWSLGYEIWYYVFFASVYFGSKKSNIILGSIVFLIMGPKLWLLLPIWFSGVFLYRNQDNYVVGLNFSRVGWVIGLVLLIIYEFYGLEAYLRILGREIWPFAGLKLGSADRYLADYVVCGIVLCNFYFAKHAKFIFLEKFSTIIKSASSYTFTLYLGHALIISMWIHYFTIKSYGYIDLVAISLIIGIFTYLIGKITEHKKSSFAACFDRLYEVISTVVRQGRA